MKKLFFTLLVLVVITFNLTAQDDNEWRYILSSTIPQGGIEVKIFNNLYTQQTSSVGGDLDNRATFFTSSFSFLYGVSNRFNAGLDFQYKSVRNESLPSSPFKALSFDNTATSRSGLTAIGPKIRFAPLSNLPKLSVQSSFLFHLGDQLSGISAPEADIRPYIDWDGATWVTQVFNDFSIGEKFAIFGEVDFYLEDISNSNLFSTPVTAILSYFPVKNITLYSLFGYAPKWYEEFDYYAQAGLGGKYQFSPQFEIEILYTYFTNKGFVEGVGKAATFNIGFRYSKQ